MRVFHSMLLLCVVVMTPHVSHAQLSSLGIDLLTISVVSGTAAPHETITLGLKDESHDLSQTMIRWSLGGTTVAAGVGLTTTDITLGDIGDTVRIGATLISERGEVLDSEYITITPAIVDLMWDTNSYAHPFFLGRTMAFPGTLVRAEARPVFLKNGTRLETSELNFEWRMNGASLPKVSGLGKNTAVVRAPALFSTGYLSVVVSSKDGLLQAQSIARIPSEDPHLTLYRIDPLLGIDFRNALQNTDVLGDSEETFTLVPYSAPTTSLLDPALIVTWLVNNTPVQTHSNDQFTISLISPAPNTTAIITPTLQHTTNYLLDSFKTWRTLFSEEGIVTGVTINPFNEVH